VLRWRLIAAAAILLPLFLLLWLDDHWNVGRPGIWLAPVAVLLGGLACHEVGVLLERAGLATALRTNTLAVVALLLAAAVPVVWHCNASGRPVSHGRWILIGLVAGVGIVFAAELWRYRAPGHSLQRLAGGTFTICYLGLPLALLMQLRIWSPDRLGLVAVVATILVVKAADTGAYFVGRAVGRHRLAPRLSPGKTVEGAIGGIVSALIAAGLVYGGILPWLCPESPRGTLGWFLLFGGSLALAGMAGDLAESLLKRDAQCKDSSPWLPGLGGILDIVDSLLGAAPVSYAWWISGLLAVGGST
jgi:phosphatidate cytidylyltransferase